jgi:hypothetical protein
MFVPKQVYSFFAMSQKKKLYSFFETMLFWGPYGVEPIMSHDIVLLFFFTIFFITVDYATIKEFKVINYVTITQFKVINYVTLNNSHKHIYI